MFSELSDFSFTKYQIEVVEKTLDLTNLAEIVAGETIASTTVEVSTSGLLDTTGMLVSDSFTDDSVTFTVQNGSINTDYVIIIVLVTNLSHVRQQEVSMTVI